MSEGGVAILDASSGPSLPIVAGQGRAWAVVWPGVGSTLRSLHRISLPAGGATVAQRHDGEAVYYVIEGGGAVAGPGTEAQQIQVGTMIHTGPGTEYVFEAASGGLELVGGPSPVDFGLYEGIEHEPVEPAGIDGAVGCSPDGVNQGINLFDSERPDKLLPLVASDARLVVWAGTGAETANMNFVDMKPGEENVPHSHSFSEDTIFVLSGAGTVRDLTNGTELQFGAGEIVHVPVGVEHQVLANRGESIVSVGGPCPADAPMLRAAGVLD